MSFWNVSGFVRIVLMKYIKKMFRGSGGQWMTLNLDLYLILLLKPVCVGRIYNIYTYIYSYVDLYESLTNIQSTQNTSFHNK